MNDAHPLDNPPLFSLLGPHAHLAQRHGQVLRYPADVSPFTALPDSADGAVWRDIAALFGPGAVVSLAWITSPPPDGWEVVMDLPGVQLVGDNVLGKEEPEAIRLGAADVPEMLDLVERAQPGPFFARTIEMGTYLGIRRNGTLIAMAGERLHPPGWTEISAVCTDPTFRGEGLATRLVLAVAAGIRERGEIPFLHASAHNTNAIRLYEALGFTVRRKLKFLAVRVPGVDSGCASLPG